MKVTGNGQQNQIRERLLLSENILPMQSGQQFYQRPEGDYLEQSELGLEFFLLMVILISR
jgi:hypothetical protein